MIAPRSSSPWPWAINPDGSVETYVVEVDDRARGAIADPLRIGYVKSAPLPSGRADLWSEIKFANGQLRKLGHSILDGLFAVVRAMSDHAQCR